MNNPDYHPLAAVFGNDEDGPVDAVQYLEGDVVARDDGAGARPVAADDDQVVVPLTRLEQDAFERRRRRPHMRLSSGHLEAGESGNALIQMRADPGWRSRRVAGDVQQSHPRAHPPGDPAADPDVALSGLADCGADQDALEGFAGETEEQRRRGFTQQAPQRRGPDRLPAGGAEHREVVVVLRLLVADLFGGLARSHPDLGSFAFKLRLEPLPQGLRRLRAIDDAEDDD